MCSIFGCFNYNNSILTTNQFAKINKLMVNRGPDYSEIQEFFFQDKVLRFGHNRLSILDLSKNGNQPMLSLCKRYTIVFNGEIYNHLELRKNQCFKNHNWIGNSDTETLLSLFSYYEIDHILNLLDGMFAFSIYDNIEKKLFLVRDRSGEKPLYFTLNPNFLAFSSDLISIMNLPNFDKRISKESLNEYMMYNYVPNPKTIFESVYQLPPSSYIKFELVDLKFKKTQNFHNLISEKYVDYKKWWNIENHYNKNNQKIDHIKNIEIILSKSIKNRLISDVPLGAFLSGGIDSSLTVALMQKLQNNTKTFTIGFEDANYDESQYAKKISNYLDTDHTEYKMSKNNLLEIIPTINEAYTEPFADSSQLPTFLISKIARDNVKVILSGDGGDELFGGYNRYLFANKYFKYINILSNFYGMNLLKLFLFIPTPLLPTILRLLILKGNKNNYNIEKIINKLKSIKNKSSFYRALTQEWPELNNLVNDISPESKIYKFNHLFESESINFEDSMMMADFQSYLPDDILCKVDRASMFFGLEARTPFLNHELIEYSQSIPIHEKIYQGKTKVLLKKILSKYVPEEYFKRPKSGFAIPISEWMKNDLKDWVNDSLSFEICKKHNLFNYDTVNRIKTDHFNGNINNEHKLWSLIQFNNWYLRYMN